MFIDSATNSITRAPAERNLSANGMWVTVLCFAPLERGKIFEGRVFYKHLAPNGAKSNKVQSTKYKAQNLYLKLALRFPTNASYASR
jgi:hypothetical protein